MFLLINKPPNITSHDVINRLRQIIGIKKIGHSGTLDPFATGLLIVGIGRESTKQLNNFLKLDKTYKATLQLGAVSNTYDKTGKIKTFKHPKIYSKGAVPYFVGKALKQDDIKKVLQKFIGLHEQIPPIYSAKKVHGKKLYELARQGKIIKIKPHRIIIYNIKLLGIKNPSSNKQAWKLKIEVQCTSGTYIRTLANDIGKKLGYGAYLKQLQRIQIGNFKLKNAVDLNKLTRNNWKKYIIKAENLLPLLKQKTRVLVFGTFDLLHKGHISFLKQAKKFGDELYVVIARDVNVKKLKNKFPKNKELIRLRKIKELNIASQVMLGNIHWQNRYHIINKVRPNIIAIGYDQKINLKELKKKLKKYNINPAIKCLKPYYPEKYKSSLIRNKKDKR